MTRLGVTALLAVALLGCSSSKDDSAASGGSWLVDPRILVHGDDNVYADCRTGLCRHNENTDLVRYGDAIWLVHRTAISQTLGPNSSLLVYRSGDGGKTFAEQARILAPSDRDLRDPHFYQVGSELYIKALTRLPVKSTRDSNVDTIAVESHSSDGVTWSDLQPVGPAGWSLWRIREREGVYYSAAYQDGDKSVVLYTSTDGTTWAAGAPIYSASEDTPLETELVFMPSGRLLALVRMDGTDDELLGDQGRLRTKVCWATAPYASFDCPQELDGQRLDGPLAFFHKDRLYVIARKHLQGTGKKRTALFEIGGALEGGPIDISEVGEVPSAGDTSYAGIADVDDDHAVISWYSGDLDVDKAWVLGMFDPTDIWVANLDFTKLP